MSKKDFTGVNPAAAFLTPAPLAASQFTRPPAPETKSARLNLVLKPSTLAGIRKIAAMHQSSVNGIINLVLEDFITKEAETINRYNSVFTEGE